MKRIPLAYLLALVAAICACAPVDDEREIAVVQLGELEQEIVMPVGYGTDSSQRRCIPSRGFGPGSFCDVPRWEHVTVGLAADHGCSAYWRNVIELAMGNMATILTNEGWGVTVLPTGAIGEVNGPATAYWLYEDGWPIVCRDLEGPSLAGARVYKNPLVDYSCDDSITWIGGIDLCPTCTFEICEYEHGFVAVDVAAISALPGYGSVSTLRRMAISHNIVLHELMHVGGLGHSTTGQGTVLMAAAPKITGGVVDMAWQRTLFPTLEELHLLRDYDASFDDTVVVP